MRHTPLVVKEAIGQKLKEKRTYKDIARELGITQRVARKWEQATKKSRPLEPLLGRPKSGLLGSFSPLVKAAISRLRPGKEGWGAISIKVDIQLDPKLSGLRTPSVRSINYYLKATQKTRSYWKEEKLPEEPVIFSRHAHDVWQMDSEGNKIVPDVGTVSFINIKDIYSKTHVGSYPCMLCGNFNHPKRKDYQLALRLAMLEFGRCARLQVDHESIYYENTNTTPYPTPFHLWALGLDIPLSYTPKAKPYKQGAVERQHQTMHCQICAGRTHPTWEVLFAFSQQRRRMLNQHIPCRMLNGMSPLQAFPEAVHSGKPYDPRNEESYFDMARIWDYLCQLRWVRTVTSQRSFSLGAQSYSIKKATPNTSVVITFDRISKMFHCKTSEGVFIDQLQPKGISFKELCGNLDDFISWATMCPDVEYPIAHYTRLFCTNQTRHIRTRHPFAKLESRIIDIAEIIRTFATHRARDGRGCSPAGHCLEGCMEQTARPAALTAPLLWRGWGRCLWRVAPKKK